jgi:hypothetical protein
VDSGEHWRAIFENWTESIPRRGVVVTTQGESITFVGFLISGGVVLLERDKPDTLGARKVMVSYQNIASIKITDVIELARFQSMGFQQP